MARPTRLPSFALIGLTLLLASYGGCSKLPQLSNPFHKPATMEDIKDEKIAVVAPEPGRVTLDEIQMAKERADRQYAASTRPEAVGGGGSTGEPEPKSPAPTASARKTSGGGTESNPSPRVASPPAPPSVASIAPPSGPYGAESYRLVNESDEIVSVLKN